MDYLLSWVDGYSDLGTIRFDYNLTRNRTILAGKQWRNNLTKIQKDGMNACMYILYMEDYGDCAVLINVL